MMAARHQTEATPSATTGRSGFIDPYYSRASLVFAREIVVVAVSSGLVLHVWRRGIGVE